MPTNVWVLKLFLVYCMYCLWEQF